MPRPAPVTTTTLSSINFIVHAASSQGETELAEAKQNSICELHILQLWIIRQGASPVKQACAIDHGITGRYHLKRAWEYDGMIARWMLRHPAEFMEQLNKFDARWPRPSTSSRALADPHVRDRGTVVTRTFG